MNLDEPKDLCCTVCGKDISNAAGIAHLYHDGRRFALCCPMCIAMFERAPARFASGERPQTIVEELIAETKWTTSAGEGQTS